MQDTVETDLSEVERIKIDRAFDRFQRLSYYDLLSVPKQADKAQIKKNYYAVSKEFHPDRYFRRNLGQYKEKLETIFDLLSRAYNTLNDDAARKAYDRSLLEDEVLGRARAQASSMYEVTFDAPTVAPIPQAAPEPVIEESAPSKNDNLHDPSLRPIFMDRLQQQLMERLVKSRVHLKDGREAFEKGNYPAAIAALKMALIFDPRSREAQELMNRATDRSNESRAESFYERARVELDFGNTDTARVLLKQCVACKPKKAMYYYKLGQLLNQERHERRLALDQFKQAAVLDPNNVDYLMTLAMSYEEFDMPRNALREYEKVVALEPSNDTALKAMKRVKAQV